MTQACDVSTPNRRALLAGLAAASLVPPAAARLAADDEDPVLALARRRDAIRDAIASRPDDPDDDAQEPTWERLADAERTVINAQATSLAGCAEQLATIWDNSWGGVDQLSPGAEDDAAVGRIVAFLRARTEAPAAS